MFWFVLENDALLSFPFEKSNDVFTDGITIFLVQ